MGKGHSKSEILRARVGRGGTLEDNKRGRSCAKPSGESKGGEV